MSGMELFGFFGSALIAVSLMMSNLKRLRWINMMGAIIALDADTDTIYYACRDTSTGEKAYMLHTKLELRAVFSAGASWKLYILQAFNIARDAVNDITYTGNLAADVASVDAVVI